MQHVHTYGKGCYDMVDKPGVPTGCFIGSAGEVGDIATQSWVCDASNPLAGEDRPGSSGSCGVVNSKGPYPLSTDPVKDIVLDAAAPPWTYQDKCTTDPVKDIVLDAAAPPWTYQDKCTTDPVKDIVLDAAAPPWTYQDKCTTDPVKDIVLDAVAPPWTYQDKCTTYPVKDIVLDAAAPPWTYQDNNINNPETSHIFVCDAVLPITECAAPIVCEIKPEVNPDKTTAETNVDLHIESTTKVRNWKTSRSRQSSKSRVSQNVVTLPDSDDSSNDSNKFMVYPTGTTKSPDNSEKMPDAKVPVIKDRRMSVGLFRMPDGAVFNPEAETKRPTTIYSDDDTIHSQSCEDLASQHDSLMKNRRKGTKIGEESGSTCTCGTPHSFRESGSTHSVDCSSNTLHSVAQSVVSCRSNDRKHRKKKSSEVCFAVFVDILRFSINETI